MPSSFILFSTPHTITIKFIPVGSFICINKCIKLPSWFQCATALGSGSREEAVVKLYSTVNDMRWGKSWKGCGDEGEPENASGK